MLAKDIQIGQRVLIKRNNMTALVVGRPEYYTPRSMLVRIKYENSTRYEHMINNQLELLPTEEQYPAHGGTHQRQENEL
jgi:hypothetical protein